MRKIILTMLLFVIGCSTLKLNSEIDLVKSKANTFEVMIEINNTVKIPAMVDSGCSEIAIPPHIAYTLLTAGKLTVKDRLKPMNYTLANGQSEVNSRFLIRELKIGEYVLKDIECSVSNNINSKILIGQNVLNRFSTVTIDYKRNKLILQK